MMVVGLRYVSESLCRVYYLCTSNTDGVNVVEEERECGLYSRFFCSEMRRGRVESGS